MCAKVNVAVWDDGRIPFGFFWEVVLGGCLPDLGLKKEVVPM